MNIAIVVKSDGLEYDDRVRKTAIALSQSSYVKIFIVQDDNKSDVGKTSYGIDYESLRLTTRAKLPSAKFLFLKTFEFYFKLVRRLKEFDAIWYNEEKTFLFPLLAPKSQVFIWDNHEIPMTFTKGWKRKLFNIIEKKSKKMLHANPQRIRYLEEIGLLKYPEKHTFIHNYPDERFVNSDDIPSSFEQFNSWLESDKYVYLQGLNTPGRKPYNSIASVLQMTNYKLVVVGRVDDEEKNRLQNDFPDLNKRVYFMGMVPQLSIPSLLKHAEFTLVLYETTKPNNKYCEANRMYQAMALGVPVIVGCNPSMKEVVADKYGIALESDGSDFNELKKAVDTLVRNREYYKKNCMDYADEYIWRNSFVDINWFK